MRDRTTAARLLEAQTDRLVPLDFLARLVTDELLRRQDRLLERRINQAGFRDRGKTLDTLSRERASTGRARSRGTLPRPASSWLG